MFVPGLELDAPITREQRHHLERVLRLRDGAAVVATDGTGRLQHCRLAGDRLEPTADPITLPPRMPQLGVMQAVPSGRKLDEITRMLGEVGVAWLQPVVMRTASAFAADAKGAARRLWRLRAIAVSALEQSRSGWLLDVREPSRLVVAVAADGADVRLLLDPSAKQRLSDVELSEATTVTVVIGPETGWDVAERAVGGLPVRLGPEVLRTEHAGLAAVAAVMARSGRW